jgi:hypothetical protein
MSPNVSRYLLIPLIVSAAALGVSHLRQPLLAQAVAPRVPTATLIPAPTVLLSNQADSNSPAVWQMVNGRVLLFVTTSFGGWPTRHSGTQLSTLTSRGAVEFVQRPPHGVWFEAIVPDVDGTWYGYYHNEIPAEICGDTRRTIPRIGAARSTDAGATWEDLGVILEAPRGWHDCQSANYYFVGGVGDFSVALDHEEKDLYFFISQYGNRNWTQGVSVARMAWADRDAPQGRVSVWWRGSAWIPSRRSRNSEDPAYTYSVGTPIYRAVDGWHDGPDVDAFWGPSVHWNTYLEQWVMLLNRARDTDWEPEGIYVAFSTSLSDPTAWSTPQRLITGGAWYPQVIGLETAVGSDRIAGERARFFLNGRSNYIIQFAR